MHKLLAISMVAFLAACGGGGGASGNPPFGPALVPFTSFTAVQANTTADMRGMSTVVNGTLSGGNVTSLTPPATDTATTTGRLTYDGTRTLSAVSAVTPGGSISFSRSANDTFTCNSGACGLTNAAGTASMVIMEPTTMPAPVNFNYQTFGAWNRLSSSTSFDAGVFSLGAATPASAVPVTGTATFNGLANGFFAPSAGAAVFTTANMTAIANFQAQSISFSTTNTQTVSLVNGATTPNGNLNLTGTFNYQPGSNLFSGAVATAPASTIQMSGTGTGRFYGPTAQEIGGIYNLNGTGGSMIGSFGGKQ